MAITAKKVTVGTAGAGVLAAALFALLPGTVHDVSFRTHDGVHYLTVEDNDTVNATRTQAFAWEELDAVPAGDGWFYLRTWRDRYLSAQPDGALEANRTWMREWERFKPVAGDGGLCLQTWHGTFVVAEEGGGGVVRADRRACGPWEQLSPSKPLGGSPTPAPTVGRLRLSGAGFSDDSGPVLPLYAHAGDLFWLFTVDEARAKAEIDDVAHAGYRGLRVWLQLGCGTATPDCRPGDYWYGRVIGPDYTPGYADKLAAFRDYVRSRGLRLVASQGDVTQLRDRASYFRQLAAIDAEAPFLDVMDGANEANMTGANDPRWVAQGVRWYQEAGGQALLTISAAPAEVKEEVDPWSIAPAHLWELHSYRGDFLDDKIRHIFSAGYEGGFRLPFGIQAEPPGNGALVSAIDNRHEIDDEGAPLLMVASFIGRAAHVWFAGEGVKIDRGLKTETGFWTSPRTAAWLPRDMMAWPHVYHAGRSRGILGPVDAPRGEVVRTDCRESTDGRAVCVIYGPSGTYTLPVKRGFSGRLCNPGDGTCADVGRNAGQTFPVSFTRGRVLIVDRFH